ncbi:MAG: hypothetical protein A2Y62_02005 [Candidatus Fischerbacteria bacterium RBG_13_37_8]|uniref:Tetratricopeptide repeat-like domain-containing protein n=1 Tax=Candidatus Fischerbacteria bacterium RBG_13_37_8 TaxID=1817863 RepID=A0A1F5VJN6_9BACT|nr:MAG: hypothetical protein A2Y62_02005 [Candidatus Fischerbacteria bacterium RBG_13_37_8]
MELLTKLLSEILTLAVVILGGGFLWYWYLRSKNPHYIDESLYEKEEYEIIKKKLNDSLSKDSSNYELLCDLGFIYRITGDNESAIQCYEKALEINPANNVETMTELARAYAEKIETAAKANELFKKVRGDYADEQLFLEDYEAHYVEIMGWIHLQKGDSVKAFGYYEQIYPMWQEYLKKHEKKYHVSFAELHYHFGIYLKRKGDMEKARSEWEKAIKQPLKNIFAIKAEQELQK